MDQQVAQADPAAGPNTAPQPEPAAATANAPITLPYYFGALWLPKYSGDTNKTTEITVVEFKNNLETMFRLYDLSEQQKIEILVGQLKGAALREVISWPADAKRDVKQVLKKLSITFETKTLPDLITKWWGYH